VHIVGEGTATNNGLNPKHANEQLDGGPSNPATSAWSFRVLEVLAVSQKLIRSDRTHCGAAV